MKVVAHVMVINIPIFDNNYFYGVHSMSLT